MVALSWSFVGDGWRAADPGGRASAMGNQERAAQLYDEVLSHASLEDWSGVAGAIGGIAGVAAGRGQPTGGPLARRRERAA